MSKLAFTARPERISPHCVRIALPDPFVPGVTSVFLLEAEGVSTPWLLDAGADTTESIAWLRSDLATLSVTPETAAGVVLSHTHLDHAGGLLRWTPARLLVHERAVAEMRNPEPASSRGRSALRRMGVPDDVARELAPEREPVGGTPFTDTPVSDPVSGERGPIPGCAGWEWLLAEGHAPGHLMVHHTADGLLLAADQFLDKWKTPLRISDPDEDSLGRYLESLDLSLALEPGVVCSSHTGAVTPAVPFLADRKAALIRQLERTEAAVREGAGTAWEVVAAGDRLRRGGLLILLLRERFAMLRHLAAIGAISRSVNAGIERFATV